MKTYPWRRLQQILTGQDRNATNATLPIEERQSLLDILRDTKPEFGSWLVAESNRQRFANGYTAEIFLEKFRQIVNSTLSRRGGIGEVSERAGSLAT